jgi:6-pyruvoyltetrahydropterin/6-carboxytetrahydropterin synthase
MPYLIRSTRGFCAAHTLKLYDGSMEPVHGHNWRVQVTVSAEKLDAIGVVMDFHELERLIDAIVVPWHNRHLNEMPAFANLNPSAENVAGFVAEQLKLPGGITLKTVEVWETNENSAIWMG